MTWKPVQTDRENPDAVRSPSTGRMRFRSLQAAAGFRIAGSLLSGLLLALSFPGNGHATLAYAALVPLMLATVSVSVRKAALLGLMSGFLFFMLSLGWLHNLTGTVEGIGLKASALLGYVVLAGYCALYFIPPAVTVSLGVKYWGVRTFRTNIRLMFSVTMTWVAAEYLRSILFTGFPWNALGISQYSGPALIQIAEWGGVYVVSACIVWMNTALFITMRQYIEGLRTKKYRPHVELMLGLLPIALSFSYGFRVLLSRPVPQEPLRVALIQPNINQTEKWDRRKEREIRETLETLTDTAARIEDIDLIIWPETALPDYVRTSPLSRELVWRMVDLGTPLLTGSMDVRYTASGRTYFNSSILFGPGRSEVARYDKQHLVPFGEYVPFPKLMKKFTPIEVDFAGGTESTLIPLGDSPPFSVLICFEDTVASLSISAVRNGARWLINQTNDAWFDPGAQSEQHLAHAVFRCIENRIPMARCCNTGVTGIIDDRGRVTRSMEPLTRGFAVNEIYPRPERAGSTFYTRHGDAFAQFSLLAGVMIAAVLWIAGRKPGKKI